MDSLLIYLFFAGFSFWVSFTPVLRPISWPVFWFNIAACAANLAGAFYTIFKMID